MAGTAGGPGGDADVGRGGDELAPLDGSIGLGLKLRGLGVRLLDPFAPALAGRLAYDLWFRTVRPADPPGARPVLEAAVRSTLSVDGRAVSVYAWGDAPRVLLVHGWSSHTGQMAGFVRPLLDRGVGVLGFDAPAHGRSPGDRTDIFEFRDALLGVARRHGPVRGVAAHSLGCLAWLAARRAGLDVGTAVLVSPGVHLERLVDAFGGRLGISEAVRTDLERRVGSFVGEGFYDGLWSPPPDRALVVHDADDVEIPPSEGRRVAQRLGAPEPTITRHLGHRRILGDPDVLARAADFLEREPSHRP